MATMVNNNFCNQVVYKSMVMATMVYKITDKLQDAVMQKLAFLGFTPNILDFFMGHMIYKCPTNRFLKFVYLSPI